MHLSKFNTRLTEEVLRFEAEGKFLERKGRDTKATHIANELIGMLNAGGGLLIYGIHDDGTVEDLQHSSLSPEIPHDLDPYHKIMHDFIKPPANIELEEIYLSDGSLVFLYHVECGYERVFQRSDNEAVYLRVADSNKVTDHKKTIISDVIESIERDWSKFNKTERKMIQYLFQNQEATISTMSEAVEVGTHAIRYNLKKLIKKRIIERQSDKIRDPGAIYCFRNG